VSLFFNVIPELADALAPSSHEFENSIEAETGLLSFVTILQQPLPPLHYSAISHLPCVAICCMSLYHCQVLLLTEKLNVERLREPRTILQYHLLASNEKKARQLLCRHYNCSFRDSMSSTVLTANFIFENHARVLSTVVSCNFHAFSWLEDRASTMKRSNFIAFSGIKE
jgi:hypothetical protein